MHFCRRRISTRRSCSDRGFTLQEILIVVAVISILITLSIPALLSALHMGKYTRWVELQKSLIARTYTSMLLSFDRGADVEIYDAGELVDGVGKALGGRDVTGRVHNSAKAMSEGLSLSPMTGNIIDGAVHRVDHLDGQQYGRYKLKGAFSLNEDGATGQCVNFGLKPASLKGGAEQFTVYAWVFPTSTAGTQTIIAHEHNVNTSNFRMDITGGTLRIRVNDQTENIGAVGTNAWNFICIKYQQSSATVWINDLIYNTGLHSAGPLDNAAASPLILGATYATGSIGNTFTGRIGEFGMFNCALDSTLIMNIHAHGRP